MQILIGIGIVIIGYIIGSIPFGLLIVKSKTGKDIRTVESGRTGGTNAVRAAGFGAGLLTAILDILKGAASVWLAQTLLPGNHLFHILAPLAAILGHNYSLFLISRDENGKLHFHGGAGGAPALGGAIGLWLPIFPIVFAVGALVWFTLGIASVTTMAIGLIVIIVFAIRSPAGTAGAHQYLVWDHRRTVFALGIAAQYQKAAGRQGTCGQIQFEWLAESKERSTEQNQINEK